MKILMVVPYVPSLIRIRPYNILRYLAKCGHEITLATLWERQSEYLDLQKLRPFCKEIIAQPLPRVLSLGNMLATLPGRYPLQSMYCWNAKLARQIEALFQRTGRAASFDVVHVEHLRGAKYGIGLKNLFTRLRTPIPVVWDSVDSISLLFRLASQRSSQPVTRMITKLEMGRTERYEKQLVNFFDHILVTSPKDRQTFLAMQPAEKDNPPIDAIPNGVDLDYFAPDPNLAREQNLIVMSGKMSYHANVSMALYLVNEVMPLVWAHKPDARVAIVGKDPPEKIKKLTQDGRVEVTGLVPDMRPYLQRATLAATPIQYGAGIQNKVLEAMACGAPVVATSGILTGIYAEPGVEILVADEPAKFASEVLRLLADPQLQKALSLAGRKFVEHNHNWDDICADLAQIYTQAGERVRANLAKSP